ARAKAALAVALALCACTNDEDRGDERLDPRSIAKFVQALPIPAVMPPVATEDGTTIYRIEARQFDQQVLPPPMPATTVWGYGRAGDPLPGPGVESTFSYPGRTIEARSGQPGQVMWESGLVAERGRNLPHRLPGDATLHWADPGHEAHGGDHGDHGSDGARPRYTGPVPIVTHVHGAHSFDHSDGYPEAWFLPDAINIPEGFSRQGP